MINLRKMSVAKYCDYFIADYCHEIAQNDGHAIEVATEITDQDLTRYFPNGIDTNEHDLLCIEIYSNTSLNVIGYL